MTKAQEAYYWRLWSMLRQARPGVDRHAEHRALGLPESHTRWNNDHFDKWIGHCKAAAQPENYRAQIAQQQMPATRGRHSLGLVLAALGAGEDYAEAILGRMNRHGAQGGPLLTIETAGVEALADLLIALKKECRRRWRTKPDLLAEIQRLREEDLDETAAQAAVESALGYLPRRGLEKLPYDSLLAVLGALRGVGSGKVEVPF